jgi:hypothetical protein
VAALTAIASDNLNTWMWCQEKVKPPPYRSFHSNSRRRLEHHFGSPKWQFPVTTASESGHFRNAAGAP